MTGSSGTLLDHVARQLITGMGSNLHTVLDIGPGQGKYGRMCRDLVPHAHLTGMEIDGDYVERFNLRALYDHVRIAPAIRLLDTVDAAWDLVILGDVIEHMRKSEGLDLLHYLVYRAKVIYVQWPMRYIQGSLDGHASEAHVSVWTEADAKGLNADYLRYEHVPLEVYVINGYPNTTHIYELMNEFPVTK